ncbi:MAG: hypothetical protein NTW32_04315 [Chloroflexi bacterium]|nr:hypothetical protein [Chloroflexota bacterium]
MVVDDNRKRTDLQPRQELRDDWATKAQCPLCTTLTLKVIHLQNGPDYFLCSHCELSFEVEQSTGIIRIKNIPEQLMFIEDELKHNWVKPSVLRKLLENRSSIMQQKARSTAAMALSDEEVWKRMLALYRLGNTPKMIELMMIQAGATQEQAETASQKLKTIAKQESKQQNLKLWITSGVTIVLILTLFASSWMYFNNQINTQLDQGRTRSATANQPNTPLQILNNLPEPLKPGFLKAPAPYVERTGPKPAHCPRYSQQAASLFGGNPENWNPGSQPGSWQMITADTPATISIPQDMYAGFINNKTFVFTAADGPATIHNVNFVVISCE